MFKRMFKRFLPDSLVIKRYVKAGALFGDAASYLYMGECIGFEKLLSRWEKWEAEYARRGYRTIAVDDFINHGGYGKPPPEIAKRSDDEKPILHAKYYRERFLGKVPTVLDIEELVHPNPPSDGQEPFSMIRTGTYALPSTKHLK